MRESILEHKDNDVTDTEYFGATEQIHNSTIHRDIELELDFGDNCKI